MTVLRGIIFDKDGTLFDFSSTWEAWAASFLRQVAKDETHAQTLGKAIGFDVTTRQFSPGSIVVAGTPDEVTEALLPHLPHFAFEDLLDLLNAEAETAPQMEAVPLPLYLAGLRGQEFRLGLVTNDAEAPARAHLRTAGITEYFDFIAGFDSGHGAKPAAGQLLAFADVVGLAPQEIVMVGDSLHDLMAARSAGMVGVGVLTGLANAATLDPYAACVLPDIGHLPDWIKSHNAAIA